jgi:hypothetical protein
LLRLVTFAVLLGACERPAAPGERPARTTAASKVAPSKPAMALPSQTGAAEGALVARIDAALERASAFLRSEQNADGSFRSELYPAFRDGYSLSPLALTVLRVLPARDAAALERGVTFTASLVQDGELRADAAAPQYPLYAVTGALLVLNAHEGRRHDAAREVLRRALAARQLDQALGYAPGHPSHGGFSYSNALSVPRHDGSAPARDNAANLSATLFAIGALRLGGAPPDDPVLRRARGFVLRCQNFADGAVADPRFDDGGFFFSPAIDDPNKAGAAGRDARGRVRHRSYGSMTADGLRALLQLGEAPSSPRVQAAAAWLEHRFDPGQNPGAFPAEAEVRRASAYYYYAWSVAHALRALGKTTLQTERGPVAWPAALAETLLARQAADGSFLNPYSELREDDPLVATPFASAALAVARMALGGEHRSHRRNAP